MAENKDSIPKPKEIAYDTNYIISYRDLLHITVVGVNKQTGITLVNINNDNDLAFKSNNPFGFGVALDYKWATLEYSQSIPGMEWNDKAKGNTDAFALRFGFTGRKFRLNTYYRDSKGFSFSDIESFDEDWFLTETHYPYFEDLRNRTLNFSMYYTFNHKKYSNTAALWQIDRQIKSAGSPVIGFLTGLEGIYAPTPLMINDSLEGSFLNIKKAEYFKIGLSGGYMYTLSLWKRFYIHMALMQGFFYNTGKTELHESSGYSKRESIGASLYYRFTAGYNGDDFYGGIFWVSDTFINDAIADEYELTNYNYLRLYVGYRFPIRTPKWAKKFYL